GAFHHRIYFRQKGSVVSEFVMTPEVSAKPGAASGPETPERSIYGRCLPPEIRIVMTNPTASTVLNASSARAILNQLGNHSQQRLVTFGQVCRLGRPVVHLGVDVDGVLAFPRRRHRVVPDSLQVGGLRAGPRTGDQQITAVLEIQCRELRIETAQKLHGSLVGWQLCRGGSAEV